MFTERQAFSPKLFSQIRQAKLEPKRPRVGEGDRCRPARGAPRETETNHPLSPRACGPMTTMVASLPPPPCCAPNHALFCALDNAQCRELQCTPRSPHGVNVRGSRVGKLIPKEHQRTAGAASLWKPAEPAQNFENCGGQTSDDADLLYWTPERASTVSPLSWTSIFGTGRRGESARCHPSRWAPERASNVSLWPGTLEWSGGVRRR